MIYTVHAWDKLNDGESFRSMRPNPHDAEDAVVGAMELLEDNPTFTLVMVRIWNIDIRFDQELGAVQFIRIPTDPRITVRVDRKENIFNPRLLKLQLEFNSIQDLLQHRFEVLKYMESTTTQIIIPVV